MPVSEGHIEYELDLATSTADEIDVTASAVNAMTGIPDYPDSGAMLKRYFGDRPIRVEVDWFAFELPSDASPFA